MTLHDPRLTARPPEGAAPFGFDEVFFSRTDERGVIAAFNGIFARVADYRPEELLGAPHKVIRHPDMPKGVFWLMWNALKSGRPVGAFVKNRARDGLHYWVYAVATPIKGGYLSVRLKPSSDLLPVIEREYAALLAREANEGLSPEASAKALVERLAALGYASYGAFQSRAIAHEDAARRKALKLPGNARILSMLGLADSVSTMRSSQAQLVNYFQAIRSIPTNLRIMASRIEPAGGPISAISDNYKLMSAEVMAQLANLAAHKGMRDVLHSQTEDDGLFILCAAALMSEAMKSFETEGDLAGVEKPVEAKHLADLSQRYAMSSEDALSKIADMVHALETETSDLRRSVAGLDSIRVMCRVEAGRLQNDFAGLTAIIDNLDAFHSEIDSKLDAIGAEASKIEHQARAALKKWSDVPARSGLSARRSAPR